ncbi:MAG: helix-turn-helix transcriptional regulator [Ruminococcus sp.]|nr:helix-turn-helix transcriptional regulator [Ruminococcus sp.]
MDNKSTFRVNLVKRRKELKLTQEQLAVRLNVSPQAVSKWENSSYPDGELLPKIARELNISLDALFGFEIENNERDIEKLISDEMRSTPPEKRTELFMKMMYSAMYAFNPNTDQTGRLSQDYEHETFSGIKTNDAISLARLNKDLRYFFFLEIPENGVDPYFGDTKNMVRLFNTLADEDSIRIIVYLGASARNKLFSVKNISEKLGIPIDKVQYIIDRLDRFGLVWRVGAFLSEDSVILYGYSHHHMITFMLVLAKAITNYLKYIEPNTDTWQYGAFRYGDGSGDTTVPPVSLWGHDEK